MSFEFIYALKTIGIILAADLKAEIKDMNFKLQNNKLHIYSKWYDNFEFNDVYTLQSDKEVEIINSIINFKED